MLVFLVFQSFMKIMSFVRIFTRYGFLVEMVALTIIDVKPFFVFFMMFILFFSLILMILRVDIDGGNEKSYPEVEKGI